jgi:superfamily I DNA/RNA helicase
VNLLGRLQPGYQQFRRLDDGVDPTLKQHPPGQDLSPLLAAAIRDLKDEGFSLNEIVVLSPKRHDSTAAVTDDPWMRQILAPADGLPAKPGRVHYSTIHAFKGLDAPAVIVTDLDEADLGENFDSLLYVGLTRATDRLVVLIESATLRHAIGGPHERT